MIKSLFLIVILLQGCASMTKSSPSVLFPKPVELVLHKNITDYDALYYNHAVGQIFSGRAFNAQVGDIAADISISALATGATIANSTGASGSTIAAIVAAYGFIANIVKTVDPQNRAMALNQGHGLVLTAQSKYFLSLTGVGLKRVSARELTPFGAALIADTNSAVMITNNLITSTLPSITDMQRLIGLDLKSSTILQSQVLEINNEKPVATVP